jgi:hypothetical protein
MLVRMVHTSRMEDASKEWRYKKSIRISSNEGELQIPKKGMLI